MYLVLSIEMQKNVYRAKHCIFIYIYTYILYIYRVENQNMEYFIAQFCHIFLSINTKNLYPILGWRFIALIQASVLVIRTICLLKKSRDNALQICFVTGSKLNALLQLGDTVSTMYNVENRIQDIGGIKGKRGSGGMNKKQDAAVLESLSKPKILMKNYHGHGS